MTDVALAFDTQQKTHLTLEDVAALQNMLDSDFRGDVYAQSFL